MNLAQAQAAHDNIYDVEAERNARSEACEAAIRQSIESDPELLGQAVNDYYGGVIDMDGQELLTEFTLALAGFARAMDKIAHGDALTDDDNAAFRVLEAQIEKAKRRQAIAVSDAVEARTA